MYDILLPVVREYIVTWQNITDPRTGATFIKMD